MIKKTHLRVKKNGNLSVGYLLILSFIIIEKKYYYFVELFPLKIQTKEETAF